MTTKIHDKELTNEITNHSITPVILDFDVSGQCVNVPEIDLLISDIVLTMDIDNKEIPLSITDVYVVYSVGDFTISTNISDFEITQSEVFETEVVH
ncbi:MAG: hypothetical protein OEM46_07730 [Ignavibacteria bacterium]|nr:hypothetical protein [Ignavibacteria bacterium]